MDSFRGIIIIWDYKLFEVEYSVWLNHVLLECVRWKSSGELCIVANVYTLYDKNGNRVMWEQLESRIDGCVISSQCVCVETLMLWVMKAREDG